jgi:lipopolysaccharide transport protein LptA
MSAVLSFALWFAAPPAKAPPVTFTADLCHYGRAMREATCSGHVKVIRGDAKLSCLSLLVLFDEQGEPEEVICSGAVRFRRGAERASAKKAHYQRAKGQIVLRGDAQVKRGAAALRGDRVTFLLDRDEVRVEGGARGRWQEVK